jgi:hypothetical protein
LAISGLLDKIEKKIGFKVSRSQGFKGKEFNLKLLLYQSVKKIFSGKPLIILGKTISLDP